MRKILYLCSMLLLSTGFSYAPLSDVKFSTTAHSINISDASTELRTNIAVDGYTDSWIKENFENITKEFFKFAESQGQRTTECRAVNELNIYAIDIETLNDRKRFNDWNGAKQSTRIVGLFDTILTDRKNSAILLTDLAPYNKIIFAHELAHYWSYRFCWDVFTPGFDGEAMAQKFELLIK